ncbi:GNAT family N-acetyltransferase [Romboutsia lituseburensis]|uniref:GNAT family N-acetyltransferase n=1 Tax=Romboutsia lituseburensis TaxID=1537 RepID=UPI00215AE6C7|nr:GNAT family N-acetyltransferase [Romboutsia lituseburensis]MCR8747240.1 GNAT family N-acetyltransferase [Romboutsia lituseburensis]
MNFPTLETSRLYLREITDDDASDIFEYLSDDTVTKYLGKESLTNVDGAYEIINKIKINYNERRGIRWGIIHKESRKLIGTIGYDVLQVKNKRADVGYDINSNYWRQGFATEAINEVINWGFIKFDLNRIGSVVFPDNIASLNLLKKIGFTKEGLLREYIIQNNMERDTVVLSLLKKEYLAKVNKTV